MADILNQEIEGRNSNGNVHEEAAKKIRSESSGIYSGGNTTVNNGASNTAFSTLITTLFTALNGGQANFFEIFTDQALTIKVATKQSVAAGIATADLPDISLRANALRTIDWLSDITEIYVSNSSGSNASVDINCI